MNTTPTAPDPCPTVAPTSGPSWGVPPERAGDVARWLDRCESDKLHPAVVADLLGRSGWHPSQAAAAALAYRGRFNEHTLGYSALLVATGLTALGAGTSGHLLTAGLDQPVNRNALAVWLSMTLCALPFAVWAHRWAADVDRRDPAAVWSRPRHSLALTLLWASGIVGVARLALYARQLVGVLVGATWAANSSVLAGFLNVMITVAIALPLGRWAFTFLHRFDEEDPTVPDRLTR